MTDRSETFAQGEAQQGETSRSVVQRLARNTVIAAAAFFVLMVVVNGVADGGIWTALFGTIAFAMLVAAGQVALVLIRGEE